MTEQLALEFRGAVKRGLRKVIGPIDMQIPVGYIVALVGPNGSGKSTILQMLMQITTLDAGEIKWFGETATGILPTELKQGIAYVPEGSVTEENFMTVEEAAGFRAHWYPSWDHNRFEELVARFNVPRKERLNRMSKGERRKFEIAAALAIRPKLLLLDEPSSGLDPFAWKDMIDELRSCMDGEDLTIVLSTHIVDEVKRLADYIVLVHQGQTLGMFEKDMLYGSFKEIWVRGELAGIEKFAEVISCQDDGPSTKKLIVRDRQDDWSASHLKELQIIKSRSLELEEILDLWIKGHRPQ
ncbi:ABC-2 type transport system ATP-binding protein [Paenibacillus anaericanus]|uniref:ATP-binding cassette domain-containing protein n=1 Tax=Paenibacillus anaericanus TaxID=170367 RepID=UPI002785D355|nr:ABC transporter ATP-binding protein [Paenibacillus anaericanus]MDQ0089264.1 ABC-2 type transport system ATP-binding protein [Paenibacillus anaericanus]